MAGLSNSNWSRNFARRNRACPIQVPGLITTWFPMRQFINTTLWSTEEVATNCLDIHDITNNCSPSGARPSRTCSRIRAVASHCDIEVNYPKRRAAQRPRSDATVGANRNPRADNAGMSNVAPRPDLPERAVRELTRKKMCDLQEASIVAARKGRPAPRA